jgi:hypothetical protein
MQPTTALNNAPRELRRAIEDQSCHGENLWHRDAGFGSANCATRQRNGLRTKMPLGAASAARGSPRLKKPFGRQPDRSGEASGTFPQGRLG